MAKYWKQVSYIVLLAYLTLGFYLLPVLGSIALICMLAPVVMAFSQGREWCGLYCPRGSLWDQVFSKINPRNTIPAWAKTKPVRLLMIILIFTVFGWQMATAWPSSAQIGLVFLRIIFITTMVGAVLAVVYSPRTWCSFCPMGTLASWLSEGKKPIGVSRECVQCDLCARTCPMQLSPYKSGHLFAHADCIKCGKCIDACPQRALQFCDSQPTVGKDSRCC